MKVSIVLDALLQSAGQGKGESEKGPAINSRGDLTETRDYASYAFRMGNTDIIELKFQDIKEFLLPGMMVDEGCADGTLLVPVAKAFPDSQLLGVEITAAFIQRAEERKAAGEYGGASVTFLQQNIAESLFAPETIDTTICNSVLHELWSYCNRAETIETYFAEKFRQLREGGRLVIRDVVGPENKEQEVYLWLNDQDGTNDDIFKVYEDPRSLEEHLNRLSTYARFRRFAEDYLQDMRAKGRREEETRVQYREEVMDGKRFMVLRLKDAVEFMTKKDYTNNWQSEMNEEFAFWDFGQWKEALRKADFHVLENAAEPKKGSRTYVNPWIVKNRWEGNVALYRKTEKGLTPMEYPVTTMILVGEKR
ncbi:methyltransferase domain-containing protein [Candidatus Woesearchaeota archaeon]|nr:methyltransferase domain-containing protein [Candidatus Woesearchaeota archaeon]